jgi:hypothetical protein
MAPILVEMERRKKVTDIIRECLKPYRLQGEVDEMKLLVGKSFIVETTGDMQRLSQAILNVMFPHEPVPCTLYHYTSFEGLQGIASSGEMRLYPIRKRLGPGGEELEAFAKAHRLEGYLDTSEGAPFFEELSDDLYYTAMTRVPPKHPFLMWSYFADGTGARLEFRVRPKAAELRPIRYEQAGSVTLLNQINDSLFREGEPSFVPWTLSRIGAFYLSSTVNAEDEVRLLMKRHPGGPDPTASDGTWAYWPIPIGVNNKLCHLDLLGIHVAPGGTTKDVEAAIKGTAFEAIPVTGHRRAPCWRSTRRCRDGRAEHRLPAR